MRFAAALTAEPAFQVNRNPIFLRLWIIAAPFFRTAE
jgi:hypothetical protein